MDRGYVSGKVVYLAIHHAVATPLCGPAPQYIIFMQVADTWTCNNSTANAAAGHHQDVSATNAHNLSATTADQSSNKPCMHKPFDFFDTVTGTMQLDHISATPQKMPNLPIR